MTYGKCHTPVFVYLLLQLERPTSKLGKLFATVLSPNIFIHECDIVLDDRIHFSHGTYYTRGLCGSRHFLIVASRDPCTAERGRACCALGEGTT